MFTIELLTQKNSSHSQVLTSLPPLMDEGLIDKLLTGS